MITALSPSTQIGEDVAIDVIDDIRNNYHNYHHLWRQQGHEDLVRLIVNIVERYLAKQKEL